LELDSTGRQRDSTQNDIDLAAVSTNACYFDVYIDIDNDNALIQQQHGARTRNLDISLQNCTAVLALQCCFSRHHPAASLIICKRDF